MKEHEVGGIWECMKSRKERKDIHVEETGNRKKRISG